MPAKYNNTTRRWVAALLVAPVLLVLTLFLFNPAVNAKTKSIIGLAPKPSQTSMYDETKWYWQADVIGYDLPTFNITKLRNLPPHNYRGAGGQAYATFFVTRNATMADPYFVAALQIVYRLLWSETSKSKYPVIVFVAPFVPDEQRKYFQAAGAIVREVALRPFEPDEPGYVPARLQDMFSKLEMWRATDFSKIAYLDSDAFPVNKTDAIFDLAPVRKCKKERLLPEDQIYAASICNYAFAAWPEIDAGLNGEHQLNAGVMVLKPNQAMYQHLVRTSEDKKGWNQGILEQAFLDHAFGKKGPFPANRLKHEWNGGQDMKPKGLPYNILHTKAWIYGAITDQQWVTEEYNQTWMDMKKLYDSPDFERLREEDRKVAYEILDGKAKPKPAPKKEG